MPTTIVEMRQRRATLIGDARGLLDRADADGALGAEDRTQYERLFGQAQTLKEQIERAEQLEAEERDLAQHQPLAAARLGQPGLDDAVARTAAEMIFEYRGHRFPSHPAVRKAVNGWLMTGRLDATVAELRALQADVDTGGGYLRPDVEFVARLIKFVDDEVFMRQLGTVMMIPSGAGQIFPSLDTDPADADWTSELGTGSADTAMAIGKRELRPHPVAKRILVSNTLLRQSGQPGAVDAESLVRQRLGYKFAITEEKGYMTGTGAQQPLGLFTASAMGISTGRDVSTGNTTTSIMTDGLQEAKWTLKPQYRSRPSTRWIFHSDALKQIAKLKDGDGQYIWRQGITVGAPDTLLNLPYVESRYAPNTFTTGLYVGVLGDLSFYWIVVALEMQLQRLVELYAATNQTGFIGRLEVDGMPVLEEAFTRVKLA